MMQCQWQSISNVLSQAGLTLPSPSDVIGGMQPDNLSIEQLSQEVIVTRFVAEAIAKGQARVEAELAAEAILESKNQEISRLRDRLRYYEAVNHEMSQRNQEIVGRSCFSYYLVANYNNSDKWSYHPNITLLPRVYLTCTNSGTVICNIDVSECFDQPFSKDLPHQLPNLGLKTLGQVYFSVKVCCSFEKTTLFSSIIGLKTLGQSLL